MKKNKSSAATIMTGVVIASCALGASAVAQTTDPVLNILIKKGILTEQEAKQVLAEAEAAKKEQEKETKPLPFVKPLGKEIKLNLGGFIQGQGDFGNVDSWQGNFSDNPANAKANPAQPLSLANPTSGNRANTHDRFRLRRARINLSGEYLERFDFKIEGDFEQTDGTSGGRTGFSATDIFVNYNQFPEAQLKVGQYKAPFGLEQLTPDTVLYTAERSLVTTALTPERQIGVQLWGRPFAKVTPNNKELVEYAFGVFNGNGRNTIVNDDPYFLYVGRLSSTFLNTTLWEQPVKWRVGGNGYYNRYAAGTRISNPLRLNPVDGSLSSMDASGPAQGWGWGVDQTLTIGPFDLVAEYLEGKFDSTKYNSDGISSFFVRTTPTSATGTLVSLDNIVANGYYVQGSYFLPGRKLQLVTKWESFNPGQDQFFGTAQAEGDDINSITGGLNWYIKGDYIKLMFDYIHSWSEFRDNHPGTGAKEFDMGIARLQLMF